jgi:hypothetical protein
MWRSGANIRERRLEESISGATTQSRLCRVCRFLSAVVSHADPASMPNNRLDINRVRTSAVRKPAPAPLTRLSCLGRRCGVGRRRGCHVKVAGSLTGAPGLGRILTNLLSILRT